MNYQHQAVSPAKATEPEDPVWEDFFVKNLSNEYQLSFCKNKIRTLFFIDEGARDMRKLSSWDNEAKCVEEENNQEEKNDSNSYKPKDFHPEVQN
jgi:hypothetical protein